MIAPVRHFSADNKSDAAAEASNQGDQSIFASADYFKDVKPDEIVDGQSAASVSEKATEMTNSNEMMFMDANDSMGSTVSYLSKDLDNLVQGIQTYGFSEALLWYETQINDLWIFFAEAQGMGMGFGVIAAALVSRAIFAPIIIYSVSLDYFM